ncbi:MAG TPA: GMC family oxidoreductase N-terminal domain-containing protein [Polyangia bacterium]|nr:GMC family oxidoreductase N-terminal domain-containing protein [Polyangia bacterium]
MSDPEFDYIVVGAGSAGCIVAGRLSADPSVRVLVLEAGGAAEENPETLRADGYKKAFINDRVIWERFSVPQAECSGAQLFMGTGRGVGGSGSVNAMVYTRGSAIDYAMWKVAGWDWPHVTADFVELERELDVHRQPPTRFTEACIAAAEASGFRRKEDLNDGTLSGFLGYEWMNFAGEERRSSYVAFLRGGRARPNLTLVTHAVTRRVLFAERRAVGVEYEHEGTVRTARARHEIILCAGALETPKLLMLSGVGPAAHLGEHGIDVVADRAGVGENLMDHPNVSIFFKGKQPTDCTWAQLYGFHRARASGNLPQEAADTCYVFYSAKSSFREGVIRMLPTMILPQSLYRFARVRGALRGAIKAAFALAPVKRLVDRMYGIVVILGKPESRGTVRLRSRDVRDQALLDPRYFAVRADLDALVAGVKLARRVAAAPPLEEWGNRELIPGRRTASDEQLEKFVRKNVMTTYHFAGTCRMGDDEAAIVDGELRVRGVRGLRVADASVIPVVPVSAMNAPSMLIGWRAARFIAEERAGRSTVARAVTSSARSSP